MPLYNFLRSWMLPLKEIDNFVPAHGNIVDLGCGQGIIATYLSRKKTRNVIGVDLDADRLPPSSQKNLRFINSDIRNYNLKNIDAIILSDVLHHINYSDQKKLFKNIAQNLK